MEAFRRVALEGPVDLVLIRADRHSVVVAAEEGTLSRIVTRVDEETLHVGVDESQAPAAVTGPVRVEVGAPRLRGLTLAGSGSAASESTLRFWAFDLTVSGSGDADLALAGDELRTAVSGSGDLRLTGGASRHRLLVSASGSVSAPDLSVEHYDVSVTGSGDADIAATRSLLIDITGTGTVSYRGRPGRIEVHVSGRGNVRPLE